MGVISASIYHSLPDKSGGEYISEVRGDTSGYKQFLPEPSLTPGKFFPDVLDDTIRKPGYSASVRHVTESEKKAVFERYKIPWNLHDNYEVDHLIPLSIGGTNDIENLWPQPYKGEWNAHVKDRLEVHILELVRKSEISLRIAQDRIAGDWINFYKKFFGESPVEAHIAEEEQ